MQYMLLIYGDENELTQAERQDCYLESTKVAHDIKAAGQFVATAPLHNTTSATSLRVRGGKRLITDGPFAETREQLGGFFLIKADDLDQALSIAERLPMAKRGTIEIRPVIELENLPEFDRHEG
jgi:hypothetical protein